MREALGQENEINDHDDPGFAAADGSEILFKLSEGEPTAGQSTRKRRADSSVWQDQINKKRRERGENYMGWTRTDGIGKRGAPRSSKTLGPPCSSKFCKKYESRHCHMFTEEYRQQLNNEFWPTMSWDQKKVYVVGLVTAVEPRLRTTIANPKKRKFTLIYKIRHSNGQNLRVCRQFFLSTFSLHEWCVRQWVYSSPTGIHCSQNFVSTQRSTGRVIRQNLNKDVLSEFLNAIPKLPSHYCRRDTKKLYLEPIFGNNASNLYNEYKKYVTSDDANAKPLSLWSFKKMVAEKNIAFHIPKKDRCDVCVGKENNPESIPDVQFNEHLANKERARTEKAADKERAIEGECLALCYDVQSVKVTPMLNASALYFKTKLCVHNFTVFDLSIKKTMCYWFDETEADLSANTFASCLVDYLEKNSCSFNEIILWSDNCTYQNKNAVMANALLTFCIRTGKTIIQKYLQKGHTQMEADSVHATLEKAFKNKNIFVPDQYCALTKVARHKMPYEVTRLTYNFTKNYGANKIYNSIRPGKKATDPTVNDVKMIKYTPNGDILTKISFDGEWIAVPRNRATPTKIIQAKEFIFPPLLTEEIKIKQQKWQHLQELKAVIPADYHAFYDNLKYSTAS